MSKYGFDVEIYDPEDNGKSICTRTLHADKVTSICDHIRSYMRGVYSAFNGHTYTYISAKKETITAPTIARAIKEKIEAGGQWSLLYTIAIIYLDKYPKEIQIRFSNHEEEVSAPQEVIEGKVHDAPTKIVAYQIDVFSPQRFLCDCLDIGTDKKLCITARGVDKLLGEIESLLGVVNLSPIGEIGVKEVDTLSSRYLADKITEMVLRVYNNEKPYTDYYQLFAMTTLAEATKYMVVKFTYG